MIRVLGFLAVLIAAVLIIWAAGNHLFKGTTRIEKAPDVANVHKDFPDHDENESASRFLATVARIDAEELRRQRELEVEYIRTEVASPAAETAAPPARVAEFLKKNAPALNILRAQLVSNPPPVWKQRADDLEETPQPDLIPMTQVFLLFSASALAEHHAHRDSAAWSDLGATWVLTRSLWDRPEVSSVLTALTGSRLIAATAAKLTAPAPKWWNDYASFNVRPPFIRSLEYEAWALRTRVERHPLGEPSDDDTVFQTTVLDAVEPLARPIQLLQVDARVRDIREIARHHSASDACTPVPKAARDRWQSTLLRFNRFILEREGTTKLLALEESRSQNGAWPEQIDERSDCRQQRWIYKRNGDGISLAFSGHVPPPEVRILTPLTYQR